MAPERPAKSSSSKRTNPANPANRTSRNALGRFTSRPGAGAPAGAQEEWDRIQRGEGGRQSTLPNLRFAQTQEEEDRDVQKAIGKSLKTPKFEKILTKERLAAETRLAHEQAEPDAVNQGARISPIIDDNQRARISPIPDDDNVIVKTEKIDEPIPPKNKRKDKAKAKQTEVIELSSTEEPEANAKAKAKADKKRRKAEKMAREVQKEVKQLVPSDDDVKALVPNFPSKNLEDAWILDGKNPVKVCIFTKGYDWVGALAKLEEAAQMSNEKDKNAMAKSIGLMGPRSSTDITAARRNFWLARGIDFDKTFNAQTGYDVGVYTGEERSIRTAKEGGKEVVEYEHIMCTPCARKKKDDPEQRCFATRPFTACTACADRSKACNFKEMHRAFVNQHVIGAAKTLQTVGKKIRKKIKGKKGLKIAIDMMAAVTEILKASDVGIPGLHESLNRYFDIQQAKIDATSKSGKSMIGLLYESRGEQVAREVEQGMKAPRRKDVETQAVLDAAFDNLPSTPQKRKAIAAPDQRATVEDYDDDMDIDEPVASGSGSGKKAIKAAPPKEETTDSDSSDSSSSLEDESSSDSD